MTLQQVLAALVLAVCLALLVHMVLGAQRQARLQRWWQARTARLRLRWAALQAGHRRRRETRARTQAAREAAELISRVKRGSGHPGRADAAGAADGAGGADGADGPDDPRAQGGSRPNGKGGDNVVRPPRFGGRRNDLH